MSETIHRKKFQGGRITPEEYHAKYAFPPDAKCMCGRRGTIRAIVMVPLDEMKKRDPMFEQISALASVMPAAAEKFHSMLVQIRGSDGKATPYVRVSTVYSCNTCRRDFEKACAKAPSYAIVEFNHGPGPDKIIST